MIRAVRESFHLVGRGYRGRWLLLLVIAVVAGGLEIAGAAMVYVLLGLVADPGGAIELPLLGDVRAWFPGVEEGALLLWLAAFMGAFFLVRATAQVGEAYLQNRVGQEAGARLSRQLVRGYLRMPYAFHLRRNSAELIRNGHTAVDELVGFVFLPVIRITAELVMITAMALLLVSIAPLAAGLALLVMGSAALVLLRVIQPRLQQLGWSSHELNGVTLRSLQQAFEGIRDIKLLGREDDFADTYGRARDELVRVRYLQITASSLPRIVIEVALIGLILLLFAGAIGTGDDAGSTLSVLGLFAYAGLRMQPSLQRIISSLNNLKFAEAPLRALHDDVGLIAGSSSFDGASADADEAIPFVRELAVEDVDFRYEGAEADSLRNVDLRVRPGEVVGICGPTGGGKTTLVDIMTGLLAPTRGRVTVDGRDLREHARGWQANLGVVPQTVFLIDDSIRHNVALGLPEEEIDDAALAEALHLAQLDEVVASMPDGDRTVVGERGVRLSGGQRQRIAIARALYRRPDVIVFDEGTSALDNTTEAELMTAIERLRGARTILMIAHRLSTVRNCDRVAFIEAGRIAGLDTYDRLAADNLAFRRMALDR